MRGLIPDLQKQTMDVLLLNIHTAPGSELLERFEFVASPTYLIFDADGIIVFRSNSLPTLNVILGQITGKS